MERPPLPTAEPESSEKEKPKVPDWWDYQNEMDLHVINKEPVALEELLLKKHPLLPGELEAFNWLKEHQGELGHELKVQLDDKGMHVIPIPSDHTAA